MLPVHVGLLGHDGEGVGVGVGVGVGEEGVGQLEALLQQLQVVQA